MEPSNIMVIGLGMGTVFFGLVCLVGICKLTSFFCGLFEKSEKNETISNKQEILAAVCAAVAEESGEDAKNIRVLSFKRI